MTPTQAAALIIMLCGITPKNVDNKPQVECMDYYVNCVIVDGKVDAVKFKTCRAEWEKQHGG